jgi:uncharacterized protein YodC (DUF2158 family)
MSPRNKRRIVVATLFLAISASCPALAAPALVSPRASVQPDATARQFERGELVRLRSGGPMMTVSAVKDDQVECVWTDDSGQPDDATFPADVLQREVPIERSWD